MKQDVKLLLTGAFEAETVKLFQYVSCHACSVLMLDSYALAGKWIVAKL